VSREEEEEVEKGGARGEVGKAGEKGGSMAQGNPGEWRGSVGGVGNPVVGRKGDLG
jgi:hypothetical protein